MAFKPDSRKGVPRNMNPRPIQPRNAIGGLVFHQIFNPKGNGMTISVSRNDLLQSMSALAAIGAVKLPVEKEQYWLTKAFTQCTKAFNTQSKVTQNKMNVLIGKIGVSRLDDKGKETGMKWIPPQEIEMTDKFENARDAFLAENITIDCHKLPMSKLKAAKVELSVADQSALEWLIDSEI
jgi:hypothetical protein